MSDPANEPLFSICIPQFNRTSFLLRSVESLRDQSNADFEVCISDGGSTDGRDREILNFLQRSGMPHNYKRQQPPAPYDRNLRGAIAMANGRYCFLLGNDDMLATIATLQTVSEIVEARDFPEVVVTNYRELSTGRDFRRVSETGLIGTGIGAAIANFRNYSFVSGVLLDRVLAQKHRKMGWQRDVPNLSRHAHSRRRRAIARHRRYRHSQGYPNRRRTSGFVRATRTRCRSN
jgi:glycosyltransferase involved in cell wall biosynthesis